MKNKNLLFLYIIHYIIYINTKKVYPFKLTLYFLHKSLSDSLTDLIACLIPFKFSLNKLNSCISI